MNKAAYVGKSPGLTEKNRAVSWVLENSSKALVVLTVALGAARFYTLGREYFTVVLQPESDCSRLWLTYRRCEHGQEG